MNTPRNNAMSAAKSFKSQQNWSAEQYEEFYDKPAPAWMRATTEEIARHIDLVADAAREHGVQLNWQNIEYGSSWQQICEAAEAKQSYRHTIGDYLPREAKRLDEDGDLAIREYFGVYYIAVNDCVAGFYESEAGIQRTCNNMIAYDIFAIRFASYDEAKQIYNELKGILSFIQEEKEERGVI